MGIQNLVPQPGSHIWHCEEAPPEHLALKVNRASVQEFQRAVGNRDSTLRSWSFHVNWIPGQSKDSIRIWAGHSCGSWRISCESRRQLWLTVWARDGRQKFQRIIISMNSHGGLWETLTPPNNSPQAQVLRRPRPNNKVFSGTQPPLITPRDMAPLTRGTRLSSTHQWAATSPSHQAACHKPLYQLYL